MELIDKPTSEFIREHRNDDVRKLAFASDKYPSVDFPLALDQIQGWQTARKKLPSWAAIDGIVYPPHLNMEQCSSEFTANYKSSLFHLQGRALCPTAPRMETSTCDNSCNSNDSGRQSNGTGHQSNGAVGHKALPCNLLIDLTGGFGVDFSFMSRAFDHAIYVERNPKLCTIAQHNFSLLGLNNVEVINSDSIEFLKDVVSTNQDLVSTNLKARLTNSVSPPLEGSGEVSLEGSGEASGKVVLFLDPARRDTYGRKMASISDCEPDVISLLPTLAKVADVLILKLSPMLDWHEAVREINGEYFSVSSVHIVSVKNECKELLLVAKNTAASLSSSPEPLLYCINDDQRFICPLQEEGIEALTSSASPGAFLYVPNSSIMKAGCFTAVASHYDLSAVGTNSHLFVSARSIDDFPGRRFQIMAVSSMNKRELRANLKGIKHANISVRNFPMSVDALRKRLKVTDGGDVYIFATTVADGSHVLIITKKVV